MRNQTTTRAHFAVYDGSPTKDHLPIDHADLLDNDDFAGCSIDIEWNATEELIAIEHAQDESHLDADIAKTKFDIANNYLTDKGLFQV